MQHSLLRIQEASNRLLLRKLSIALLALFVLLPTASALADAVGPEPAKPRVAIYYSSGCTDCVVYIGSQLIPLLRDYGYNDIVTFDVWNDRMLAVEMMSTMDSLGIPKDLRGHLATFIGDRIAIQDHIPMSVVRSILEAESQNRLPDRLLLQTSQDMGNMHGRATQYTLWDHEGPRRSYPINASIERFLADRQQEAESASVLPTKTIPGSTDKRPMLGLIISAGLLDGINPCAFAVLIFFTAFLFAARRARGMVRTLAVTYVVTSLVVYFLIGLGIIGSVSVLTKGHLVSKIAAGLTISLGVLGIVSWALPGLRIPRPQLSSNHWERAKKYLVRSTIPATMLAAFLVTLCTLPCSGFMYLSILALLATETTRSQGLGYLIIYNLAFITPLVLVAIGVTNRHTARTLAQLERKHHRLMHLASSVAITVMGLAILLWMM